jgi:hypothetical protein
MKKALLFPALLLLAACSSPNLKDPGTKSPVKPEPEAAIPTKTVSLAEQEAELVKAYEIELKVSKLDTINGFPQYKNYLDSLSNMFDDITVIVNAGNGKLPKLRKFQAKLLNKITEADHDYVTYGQPIYESDLTIWCEPALKSILNDPSSLEDEEYKIKGQSKKGWIVLMKYRAKNAFGAYIVNVAKIELQFDSRNNIYNAISIK